MSKDDDIQKKIQEWRELNTFFRIFNPDKYNLSQSLDFIVSKLKPELMQLYSDADREQIIYEAFSSICTTENKNLNSIESLADLLYSKHRLEIHCNDIGEPRLKP
jgi:hypothetical protein